KLVVSICIKNRKNKFKTIKKAPFLGALYNSIPLSLSLRFSCLFKRSNSPLGDFSLTLFTNSLNTSLTAFKPSVRCFKNSLVLLYIEPISCFNSYICIEPLNKIIVFILDLFFLFSLIVICFVNICISKCLYLLFYILIFLCIIH